MIKADMDNKRFSHLADMLVCHILAGRILKALKIAQYLRRNYGDYIITDLNPQTGHRVKVK